VVHRSRPCQGPEHFESLSESVSSAEVAWLKHKMWPAEFAGKTIQKMKAQKVRSKRANLYRAKVVFLPRKLKINPLHA